MDLTQLRIRRLELDDSRLLFSLDNGIRIDEPIRRHVRLDKATLAQRDAWQLTDDHYGVNWPQLSPPGPRGLINMLDLLWERRLDHVQSRLRSHRWIIDELSAADQQLVALWRLEADMWNGGFMQFLGNWGEDTSSSAQQALLAIGAIQTAGIVAGMQTLLERFAEDPEIDTVNDMVMAMSSGEQQQLEALEEQYYRQPDDQAALGLLHYGLQLV